MYESQCKNCHFSQKYGLSWQRNSVSVKLQNCWLPNCKLPKFRFPNSKVIENPPIGVPRNMAFES